MLPTYYTISGESQEKPQLSLRFQDGDGGFFAMGRCPLIGCHFGGAGDVRKRAREAFDEYAGSYDGETVLVCAHDAVNKAILCDLLGLPMSHFWQIKQDNACINVIECDHGIWRLVTLNATTHLGYLVSGIEQKGL